MTQYVICALQMEGFHCWPEADGELAYLKNSHRHIFFITAEFPVRNANREIEIISQQNAIKRYLLSKYGDEDGACHFGRRSCEDIAAEILNQFENSTSCPVLEDGCGGARVVRYQHHSSFCRERRRRNILRRSAGSTNQIPAVFLLQVHSQVPPG